MPTCRRKRFHKIIVLLTILVSTQILARHAFGDVIAEALVRGQLGRPYGSPIPNSIKHAVALSQRHLAIWSGPQSTSVDNLIHVFHRLDRGRLSAPIEIVSPAALVTTSASVVSLAMDDSQLIVAESGVTDKFYGAVYVYDLTGSDGPVQCQTLYDPEFEPQIPADCLLLVGDDLYISSPDVSAVVHWSRDAEGFWRRRGKIVPPGTPNSTWRFGTSLASDGSSLVIGAPGESTRGTVYTYERVKDDTWGLVQKLSSPTTNSLFGSSVAIEAERLVVGAPAGAGAALVYSRVPGGWSAPITLPAISATATGAGSSVAFFGGRILVGIPGALSIPSTQSVFKGGIGAYTFDGAAWNLEGLATWPDVPASDTIGAGFSQPGVALSISGNDLATTPSLLFSLDPLDCSSYDTDDDGLPDCVDEDIDGDLIPNSSDACRFDRDRGDPNACGCGNPIVDSDDDGAPDCLDNDDDNSMSGDSSDLCRTNPARTLPDRCGCEGAPPTTAPLPARDPCPKISLGFADTIPIARMESNFITAIDDLAADGNRLAFRAGFLETPTSYPTPKVVVANRQPNGRVEIEQWLASDPGNLAIALRDDILFAGGKIYRRVSYGNWRAESLQGIAAGAITADIDGGRILINSTFPSLLSRNASGVWISTSGPMTEDTEFGGTALRGDLAFVGSPKTRNAVHIYRVQPQQTWQLIQTVTPPFPIDNVGQSAYFGISLAVDGDWLIVAADSANQSKGLVFAYRRNADGFWEFRQVLSAPGFVTDHFGCRIEAKGGLLAVPFSQYQSSGGRSGVVLYRQNLGYWHRVAQVASAYGNEAYWPNVTIGDGFVALDAHRAVSSTFNATAVRCYALDQDDANHDGIPDPDSDGDGVCDSYDRCPDQPDLDTDLDGLLDCVDPLPTSVQSSDADFDGVPAPVDACDLDPTKTSAGQCGCGVVDSDFDEDGSADCVDTDDDNDGVADANEYEPCRLAPPTDTDGDGAPDCADYDDDNDGISDAVDRCPGEPDGTGVPICYRLNIKHDVVVSPDGIPGDRFGAGLAIDANRLAVGEPGRNRVSIFESEDGAWQRVATVEPAGTAALYGFSVALSGDVLVVGDPTARTVEVRSRSASGAWELRRRIDDADFGMLIQLGLSVAIGDGYFIASAPFAVRSWYSRGAVVFGRVSEVGEVSDLRLIDHPLPRLSGGGDRFGNSITARGSRIAIAAWYSGYYSASVADGFVTVWEVPPVAVGEPPELLGFMAPTAVSTYYFPEKLGTHLALDPFGGLIASTTVYPTSYGPSSGRFGIGFSLRPDGDWSQLQPGSVSYPSLNYSSYSRGFDTSGSLHVATWRDGGGATRVERLTAAGRSELVGFLPINAQLTTGDFGDAVAIGGTLVASGSPDVMDDGVAASGLVRVFDLKGMGCEGDPVDCDGNGVLDGCDFANGTAIDTDDDLRIDSCERALGDLNLDGEVDATDLSIVLVAWDTIDESADATGDGIVDAADLSRVLANWGTL